MTRRLLIVYILLGSAASIPDCVGMQVDPHNLVALDVRPTASTASGYIAWHFLVMPVDKSQEVSSIDAASGDYGLSGSGFRQVNPFGLSTIFADRNEFFGAGEDETTDTQFTFSRSDLMVVADSAVESSEYLKATFTGFIPILASDGGTTFAQVVMPSGGAGVFHGAFAVRPIGGGQPQIAVFEQVAFTLLPGDFNNDRVVDAADYCVWRDNLGDSEESSLNWSGDGMNGVDAGDYALWRSQFGQTFSASPSSSKMSAPDPDSVLIAAAALLWQTHGRRSRWATRHQFFA